MPSRAMTCHLLGPFWAIAWPPPLVFLKRIMSEHKRMASLAVNSNSDLPTYEEAWLRKRIGTMLLVLAAIGIEIFGESNEVGCYFLKIDVHSLKNSLTKFLQQQKLEQLWTWAERCSFKIQSCFSYLKYFQLNFFIILIDIVC